MGPVVIEIVASTPPAPDLSRALIEGCERGRGNGGCVLDLGEGSRSEAVVRVTVSFTADWEEVRIRSPLGTRALRFRDSDPFPERFLATGLVVASLVRRETAGTAPAHTHAAPESALPTPPPTVSEPDSETNPAPETPPEPEHAPIAQETSLLSSPTLSAAALIGVGGLQPRAGMVLSAGLGVLASPAFVLFSVSYEQTVRNDPQGLGDQETRLGAGGGVRIPLGGSVTLLVPVQLALEHLRVGVTQPLTGRQDASSRLRAGAQAGVDLAIGFGPALEAFVGSRASLFDESTRVRVQGDVEVTIPAWEVWWEAGLNIRLP